MQNKSSNTLFDIKPFSFLSEGKKKELMKNLKEISLQPGEQLNDFDKLMSGVVYIEKGVFRLLGLDDNNQMFSLDRFSKGEIFGVEQILRGVTGEVLLQLCESRLDNMVYRFGLSPSRSGARQLVSHRHITVNGSIVNIPSYQVKKGDVVGVREKSKSLNIIQEANSKDYPSNEWLSWNKDKLQGTYVNVPERAQIPETIKEQLIVELYSK